VDAVVPHIGRPKSDDHDLLEFDILFTGEEYRDSSEMCVFTTAKPTVSILYAPRGTQVSTTELIASLPNPMPRILASSIAGPVTISEDRTVVYKNINVTEYEYEALRLASIARTLPQPRVSGETDPNDHQFDIQVVVHDLPTILLATGDPLGMSEFPQEPRNWKNSDSKTTYPMIAGVNAWREIATLMTFKDKPWCPYIAHTVVFVRNSDTPTPNPATDAHDVAERRACPKAIIRVAMHNGGIPLTQYLDRLPQHKNVVYTGVHGIIAEINSLGVVHGDVHGGNVLVKSVTATEIQLSIVDFGWTTSTDHKLTTKERVRHEQRLANTFDHQHFNLSGEHRQ
jgi:hypothetical protein